MTDQYLGELRLFAGVQAPSGWHFCDGSLVPVSANEALFALLGTAFGGDGRTNFGLPDLRGRVPVGMGAGPALTDRVFATSGGSETVTLTQSQVPIHTHQVLALNSVATTGAPAGMALAAVPSGFVAYLPSAASGNVARTLDANTIASAGVNQAHSNEMPFLAINYIIALQGQYPVQS